MHKNNKIHSGHFKRIRAKIEKSTPATVEDITILEGVLQFAYQRADINEIARYLLIEYGSLDELFETATADRLMNIQGIGKNMADKLTTMFRCMHLYKYLPKSLLIPADPEHCNDIKELFRHYFQTTIYERAVVILLNAEKIIIHHGILYEGDEYSVHMNSAHIIKFAAKFAATYVVIAHNHVCGEDGFFPSIEDFNVTEHIYGELRKCNLKLLDHIIYCNDHIFSFANSCLIETMRRRFVEAHPELKNADDDEPLDFDHEYVFE
ncbi:MAG: hypothetical protein IJ301_05405 [Clostridia bacterium]|nr:hypothetical protein [Clostridia bacterium]